MDPISLAVGAVLVVTGYLVGHGAGSRKQIPPKPPEAWCGCRHHLGDHSPVTGRCNEQMERVIDGKKKWVPCTCLHYVGYIPADRLLATWNPNPALGTPEGQQQGEPAP